MFSKERVTDPSETNSAHTQRLSHRIKTYQQTLQYGIQIRSQRNVRKTYEFTIFSWDIHTTGHFHIKQIRQGRGGCSMVPQNRKGQKKTANYVVYISGDTHK